jgi:hypothetical protein
MNRYAVALILAATGAAGCTPTYRVHVNTFSELREPLSQTASIFIATDPNSRNPILARSIASKIGALLEERGYTTTAGPQDAGYVLTFRAGIDSTRVMDYQPVARPFGGFYGFYGGRFRGLGYGYTTYVPYLETVYAHWLDMRLLGRGETVRDGTRPLWIGEAVVGRSDPELRDSVNYLLVGLMDYFTTDTRQWVTLRIRRDDPRVQGLVAAP